MDWEQKLHSVLWAYRCAYKMAIDTTPFNLVFGLDAIIPIQVLIPTLRAAQDLPNGRVMSYLIGLKILRNWMKQDSKLLRACMLKSGVKRDGMTVTYAQRNFGSCVYSKASQMQAKT